MQSPTAPQAGATPDHDALYRRIAWRVVPFLFICYVVNYIDRVNIGFAKLQFLQDLKLNDAAFGLAAGMFFIGYLVFELPSNLLLARIGVRKTLMRILVLWGAFTVLLMFVKTGTMLYVLRFLLGAAEAGFFPGVIFYLSLWFPNQRRARVTSLFIMAAPLAGIIGGPLSGWIMDSFHDMHGLRGWQWLFLIEGVPAIVLGLLALVCLTDKPQQARWLSDSEKAIVSAEIEKDHQQQHLGSSSARLGDALRSPRLYLLSAIYFTAFMGLNAVGFWIPTILKGVGVQTLTHIGWLSGAISLCTAVGIFVIGRSSDHHVERRWHTAMCGFAAAASFLLLPLTAHSAALTVALLAVASIGMLGVLTIFWTIPATYLRGTAAAGGIAVISSLGAIGGFVSPTLVGALKAQTGSIYTGLAVVAALLIAGMIALLLGIPAARKSGDIVIEPAAK